jgi:hypothetical protein
MRILRRTLVGVCLLLPSWGSCQAPPDPPANPFARRYAEGELVAYELRGSIRGRERTLKYTAKAIGSVGRDRAGAFEEEFGWTSLAVDGNPVELPDASRAFRQQLSLAPDAVMRAANLATVHPDLFGPILDLHSFYADLGLAARMGGLAKAGDHARVSHNRSNSWADGRVMLVGEEAMDFDVTLQEVDTAGKTATLVVRHVPPENPAIRITAEWMRRPVAGSANNWTQVHRSAPGKYAAAVGAETIDVRYIVDLRNGRILSAVMDSLIEVLERVCDDVDAKRCGEPSRYRFLRTIELISAPASP